MTKGPERLLAAAGIGFAAALALAGLLDERSADAYLLGLAAFLLVAFLGALRGALRWIEGETAPLSATAVIGGSAVVALYLVMAATYLQVGRLTEGEANVHVFAFAASFAQAAVLAAAGAVMARTGVVSRTLGAAGLLLALGQLAAPLVLLDTEADWAVALALAPFAAWVATVGLILAVRPGGRA